jgi:integrase
MLERAAESGGIDIKVHPHMLRHACGFGFGQRGARHTGAPSVSRAQEHPAHGALYGIGADPVQELLARLGSVFDGRFDGFAAGICR